MSLQVTTTDLGIGADEKAHGVVSATEIVAGDATMIVLVVADRDFSGTFVGIWTPHPAQPARIPSASLRRALAMERAYRNLDRMRQEAARSSFASLTGAASSMGLSATK